MRLHLIAISEAALSASNITSWQGDYKDVLGYSKGICWVVKSRSGFVLPRNGEILWAHSVRVHPIVCSVWLGHGDEGSREWVKNLVGNDIEHDIWMSMICKNIRDWMIQTIEGTSSSMRKHDHKHLCDMCDIISKMQLVYLYSSASGRLKELCPRGK